MAKLSAREKALVRAAMEAETRDLKQGAMNTASEDEFLAQYPRMMYRKTDVPVERVLSTHNDGRPREVLIENKFAGYLCDTIVAESADEAEALSADGWDITPQAAHGQASGMVEATTAKDDEIASLRAQIAAMEHAHAAVPATERRGPGRPPRVREEGLAQVE